MKEEGEETFKNLRGHRVRSNTSFALLIVSLWSLWFIVAMLLLMKGD